MVIFPVAPDQTIAQIGTTVGIEGLKFHSLDGWTISG